MPLEEPFEVKVAKSENHQYNDDDVDDDVDDDDDNDVPDDLPNAHNKTWICRHIFFCFAPFVLPT